MLRLFCNLDGFLPFVHLLIHLHRLFNLIVFEIDGLSPVELLFEHGKSGLNLVERDTIFSACLLFVLFDLPDNLPEELGLRDITQCSIAVLGNIHILRL